MTRNPWQMQTVRFGYKRGNALVAPTFRRAGRSRVFVMRTSRTGHATVDSGPDYFKTGRHTHNVIAKTGLSTTTGRLRPSRSKNISRRTSGRAWISSSSFCLRACSSKGKGARRPTPHCWRKTQGAARADRGRICVRRRPPKRGSPRTSCRFTPTQQKRCRQARGSWTTGSSTRSKQASATSSLAHSGRPANQTPGKASPTSKASLASPSHDYPRPLARWVGDKRRLFR